MNNSVIRVNPTKYDKETYKKVLDISGKVIKFSDKGTVVENKSFYHRLVKAGDLEIVKPQNKPEKKKPKKQE